MLGIGGFNPLDGFMGEVDWKGVCDNMTMNKYHKRLLYKIGMINKMTSFAEWMIL
jgi:ATP sulfurylase